MWNKSQKDSPTNKLQVHLPARKAAVTPLPNMNEVEAPHSRDKNIFRIAGVLLLFVILAAMFYVMPTTTMFGTKKQASLTENATQNNGKTEMQIVLEEVGKQYLLPEGEVPTLALVTSLDDIKTQPFFAKAQVGDVVLMYLEAKKGILWRPSTKQIVEVGPLRIKDPDTSTITSP